MCNANAGVHDDDDHCPSACNAAGTDCNACPAGETMCPNGCQNLNNDPDNCGMCGQRLRRATGGRVGIGDLQRLHLRVRLQRQLPSSAASTTYCQSEGWGFEGNHHRRLQQRDQRSDVGVLQRLLLRDPAGAQLAHSRWVSRFPRPTAPPRGFQVGLPLCAAKGFLPGKSLVRHRLGLIPRAGRASRPRSGKASYWGARVDHRQAGSADQGGSRAVTGERAPGRRCRSRRVRMFPRLQRRGGVRALKSSRCPAATGTVTGLRRRHPPSRIQ